MRAVLQRVSQANCVVDGSTTGSIQKGLLVFLGVGPTDTRAQADKLLDKIVNLRIFDDEAHHMNRSLLDIKGELLVISQFTLFANCKRGRRPSFTEAAAPDLANELYEYFLTQAKSKVTKVEAGIFGADMQISLTNSGPVTIWLDTDEL